MSCICVPNTYIYTHTHMVRYTAYMYLQYTHICHVYVYQIHIYTHILIWYTAYMYLQYTHIHICSYIHLEISNIIKKQNATHLKTFGINTGRRVGHGIESRSRHLSLFAQRARRCNRQVLRSFPAECKCERACNQTAWI